MGIVATDSSALAYSNNQAAFEVSFLTAILLSSLCLLRYGCACQPQRSVARFLFLCMLISCPIEVARHK